MGHFVKNRRRTRAVAALAVYGAAARLGAQTTPPVGHASLASAPPSRVVCRFDFDERVEGNLEDIPKYWVQLRPEGFPHYARGAFDEEIGHDAPPSFHLVSEGRNVAYQYAGPATRVRAFTDYRIEAFIRADRLDHARACISAHYLDKQGRAIAGTLVRSRFVGGPVDGDRWVPVEFHLPAATANAHTIAITGWVLQRPTWDESPRRRWHIPHRDVHGGAWFDDITVYSLPFVELTTHAPGNVLSPDDPLWLDVQIVDNEDRTLVGRLSIMAADGGLVETRDFPVAASAGEGAVSVRVDHLQPGLYQARVDVLSGGTSAANANGPPTAERAGAVGHDGEPAAREPEGVILTRTLTFARVGGRLSPSTIGAQSFGVAIDPRERTEPDVEFALLQGLGIRSAKVPIWTGLADDSSAAPHRRAMDRLLQELIRKGFVLTGVLAGPPAAIVQRDGPNPRPVVELLADDPGLWREHLASFAAPYAAAFRWWQLGPDETAEFPRIDQLETAITQLREAMQRFMTAPRLTLPIPTALQPPEAALPVEQLMADIASDAPPQTIRALLQPFVDATYEQVAAYVEPLSERSYDLRLRLADFAQRILIARHSGARTVFVPQPWHVRATPRGPLTEPTESYIVLRTIAHVLSDADPGPMLPTVGQVHALSFVDGDEAVVALWSSNAPHAGDRVALQLGAANRVIDMWGRSTALDRDEQGRQIVTIGSVPVLVPGVERWLLEFQSAFSIVPSIVESGMEFQEHTIEVAYQGAMPVSGELSLEVPESWSVSPRRFSFQLAPQRVGRFPIQLRYPHNEPAGTKNIIARAVLTGTSYYLEIPLELQTGLAGVDVWGMAVVEGRDLVVRQTVTNRTERVLSFRASAAAPGRERQYRPIPNLNPLESQMVEYRIPRGNELIGRSVWLALREMNDGPRAHNLALVVP